MNRKILLTAVIAVAVVATIAIFAARFGGGSEEAAPGAPLGEDVFRPENPDALSTVEGGTREVIQEEIATPEVPAGAAAETGSEPAAEAPIATPEGIAIPQNVTQVSGPSGEAGFRDFIVRAENGKYFPDKIVVNDGDVITIQLTAVDGDYNIFFPDFGSYLAAKQGETKKTQFQATPFGQYRFYCEACGNGAEGTLIVNQK